MPLRDLFYLEGVFNQSCKAIFKNDESPLSRLLSEKTANDLIRICINIVYVLHLLYLTQLRKQLQILFFKKILFYWNEIFLTIKRSNYQITQKCAMAEKQVGMRSVLLEHSLGSKQLLDQSLLLKLSA